MNYKKLFLEQEKIIAIFIFVLGMFMSILVPTGQTPDEYSHLNMIGNSVGVKKLAPNLMKSIDIETGNIAYHYDKKVNMKEQINSLRQKKMYTRKDMLPRKISVTILKHFPATMGIYIGILLGLPAYWVLQLGEVVALIFYTYVCYKSLKIIPVKKTMLACFMLFPMALQQAASLNYDAVLIPLCYLFISYILYLKYEKERIELKDFICVIIVWAIITYIKIPYIFLVFLIFILPIEKIYISLGPVIIDEKMIKRMFVPVSVMMFIAIIIGVYTFRKIWIVQVLYGFVMEWKRAIYLLSSTGKTWGEFLFVSTVGNLGWLDTPICLSAAICVFAVVTMFALMRTDSVEKNIAIKDFLIIEGTAIMLCLFVTIALTNHTIMVTLYGSESAKGTYEIRNALYQIPYIGGLQGRYYLPVCPLFFVPLPTPISLNSQKQNMVLKVMTIVLYIYIIIILVKRYWIA